MSQQISREQHVRYQSMDDDGKHRVFQDERTRLVGGWDCCLCKGKSVCLVTWESRRQFILKKNSSSPFDTTTTTTIDTQENVLIRTNSTKKNEFPQCYVNKSLHPSVCASLFTYIYIHELAAHRTMCDHMVGRRRNFTWSKTQWPKKLRVACA